MTHCAFEVTYSVSDFFKPEDIPWYSALAENYTPEQLPLPDTATERAFVYADNDFTEVESQETEHAFLVKTDNPLGTNIYLSEDKEVHKSESYLL